MFITSFLHLNQSFLVILGEFQSDFCQNFTEFDQSSPKILVYLTDFSPQFMAFMSFLSSLTHLIVGQEYMSVYKTCLDKEVKTNLLILCILMGFSRYVTINFEWFIV